MKLARIAGNVVATIKHPVYDQARLLLAEPITTAGKVAGNAFILVDAVQAGPGDVVIYVDEGNSARAVLHDVQAPVRAVAVAIVDAIDRERT